jgi:hypothetical protein
MRHCDAIEGHYREVWGPPDARLAWSKGPVQELPRGFTVLSLARKKTVRAYATCCMSTPQETDGLELHMLVRESDRAIADRSLVELLTVVAHYHRTGRRLGLGHTVNFGRPWLPDSRCTHGLISLPYLDGPRLEWMEDPRVRFLWLIPITPEEAEFKKQNGLEALEERFEAANFDYLDPARPPVLQGSSWPDCGTRPTCASQTQALGAGSSGITGSWDVEPFPAQASTTRHRFTPRRDLAGCAVPPSGLAALARRPE